MQHRHTQKAFTLIELSIVLVIIGLIVGGVLVGKDLIDAAKVRSQISQIEAYTAAATTFRLKYNCLPGDCPNAVTLGLGTNASYHNGDGDKKINKNCMGGTRSTANGLNAENDNFFYHLASAGLVDGAFATGYQGEGNGVIYTEQQLNERFPAAKAPTTNKAYIFPTYFGVADCNVTDVTHFRTGGNGFMLSHLNLRGGNDQFRNTILPRNAWAIDSKIDDGKPYTGNVGNGPLGNNVYKAVTVNSSYTSSACTTAIGSNEYPITNNNYQNNDFYGCRITFLNRF